MCWWNWIMIPSINVCTTSTLHGVQWHYHTKLLFAIPFFFLWFWLSGVQVIWDNCWHVVPLTSQVESFGQFCLRLVFLVFVAWYHWLTFDPRSWWGTGSKYFGEESLWADVSSTPLAPPWLAWTGHWLTGHWHQSVTHTAYDQGSRNLQHRCRIYTCYR